MKRIIFVILSIVLIVALSVNVSAASTACVAHINPADHVTNIVVSGDVKTVYYDLPLNESFRVGVRGPIYNEPFSFVKDARFDSWGISGETVFPVYPLGYGNTISVDDLRVGAELTFSGDFQILGWATYTEGGPVPVRVTCHWFWFDADCNQIGYDAYLNKELSFTLHDGEFSFDWVWTVPEDAVFVYPRFDFRVDVDLVEAFTATCTAFALHHDVNMLLDNSQTLHRIDESIKDIGGKLDNLTDGIYDVKDKLDDIEQSIVGPGGTIDKLDDVKDKLDDIEQSIAGPGGTHDKLDDVKDKLDDITDYVPVPDGPEGGEISDGLVDAEDKLLDEVQDGMSEVGDIQTEAHSSFLTYVHAVSVMTWMLNLIIEGSVMRGVLVISLALGTCAFLLNLSVQLMKDNASASKNKSAKNRTKVKRGRGS